MFNDKEINKSSKKKWQHEMIYNPKMNDKFFDKNMKHFERIKKSPINIKMI